MSHQPTFADSEFNNKRRKTRKEIFHSRMNELMPWDELEAVIEPFLPQSREWKKALSAIYHVPYSLHATLVQHE
jgi:IS5 family transposase